MVVSVPFDSKLNKIIMHFIRIRVNRYKKQFPSFPEWYTNTKNAALPCLEARHMTKRWSVVR